MALPTNWMSIYLVNFVSFYSEILGVAFFKISCLVIIILYNGFMLPKLNSRRATFFLKKVDIFVPF